MEKSNLKTVADLTWEIHVEDDSKLRLDRLQDIHLEAGDGEVSLVLLKPRDPVWEFVEIAPMAFAWCGRGALDPELEEMLSNDSIGGC